MLKEDDQQNTEDYVQREVIKSKTVATNKKDLTAIPSTNDEIQSKEMGGSQTNFGLDRTKIPVENIQIKQQTSSASYF